jgi:hypothetical protein
VNQMVRRSRLLPWDVGLAIVIVAVAYVAYEMFYVGCPAPALVELIVLLVIPAVYLALMYLTLVSQE